MTPTCAKPDGTPWCVDCYEERNGDTGYYCVHFGAPTRADATCEMWEEYSLELEEIDVPPGSELDAMVEQVAKDHREGRTKKLFSDDEPTTHNSKEEER